MEALEDFSKSHEIPAAADIAGMKRMAAGMPLMGLNNDNYKPKLTAKFKRECHENEWAVWPIILVFNYCWFIEIWTPH